MLILMARVCLHRTLRLESTETDGKFDIDTAGDCTNPPTAHCGVCLSLLSTRRVGANDG